MSAETYDWLRNNIVVGFQDIYRRAWWVNGESETGHAMDTDDAGRPNHYPQAVPMERVQTLFDFDIVPRRLFVARSDDTAANARHVPNLVAQVDATTGTVLGVHSDGWKGHDYRTWLIEKVAAIADTDLDICTAGLLRSRAQGFVSFEVPETLKVCGLEHRPRIMSYTSYDASLATNYMECTGIPLCDNTFQMCAAEDGGRYKVKHTRYSDVRLLDARDALAIAFAAGDAFAAEVEKLAAVTVSPADWARLLDVVAPVTVDMSNRSKSFAQTKRGDLSSLYLADPRCAPWSGTAFGVVQTFNTYAAHVQTTRDRSDGNGGGRIERNFRRDISGTTRKDDAQVLAKLADVLGRPDLVTAA